MTEENKEQYIVKDKESGYLIMFDKYVNDMDIITTAEPVGAYQVATKFDSKEEAEQLIKDVTDSHTYDTSNFVVDTVSNAMKQDRAEKISKDVSIGKEAWKNTEEKVKRKILYDINKKYGDEGTKDFLGKVEDTSGIMPYTEDEVMMLAIDDLAEHLGIQFTSEQIEQLKDTYKKGGF